MGVRRLLTTLAALSLLAPEALAQNAPNGRLLRPGTDSLVTFLVRGADTVLTGLVVDEIAFANEGGREVIRRVYRSLDRRAGVRLDSLVDDFALRPVRHYSRGIRDETSLLFDGNRVSGWARVVRRDTTAVDAQIDSSTYSASSIDLVIRASSLSESWHMETPMFLSSTRRTARFHARVAGTDTIDGISAWRVEADFNGMPVTFWVAKDSRALVRQKLQLNPEIAILYMMPRESRRRPRGPIG